MALFCKLPGGGGLSKTKPVTSIDIRKAAAFGDLIKELSTDYGGSTCGGAYYEETGGQGKLYVVSTDSSGCYVKTYTITGSGIQAADSIKINSDSSNAAYTLHSDEASKVLVMSQMGSTSQQIYCIDKTTHAVSTISRPTYNGELLSINGATIKAGVIYVTVFCNLIQPFLYTYNEAGSVIRYYDNKDVQLLYGNSPVGFDASGNIYMSCNGNSSNNTSTAIVSVTSGGNLRWRKTIEDFAGYGVQLLTVKPDGTCLCVSTINKKTLIVVSNTGQVLRTEYNYFAEGSALTMNAKWLEKQDILYLQDIGGCRCYLCESDLSKTETFTISKSGGFPAVVFCDDKIVVARTDSTLRVETRKPYAEYLKR